VCRADLKNEINSSQQQQSVEKKKHTLGILKVLAHVLASVDADNVCDCKRVLGIVLLVRPAPHDVLELNVAVQLALCASVFPRTLDVVDTNRETYKGESAVRSGRSWQQQVPKRS